MKHIIFLESNLFYLYLFSLSAEENWTPDKNNYHNKSEIEFTSENYKFSLLDSNGIQMFNSFHDVDMIVIDLWSYGDISSCKVLNDNIIIPSMQNNIDIIAFNWVGETHGGIEKKQFNNSVKAVKNLTALAKKLTSK